MNDNQPIINSNQRTIENLVTEYKESLQWLKSLVELSPFSRFEKYLKVILELSQLNKNGDGTYSIDDLIKIQNNFTSKIFEAAILEGQELIEIYNVFGKKNISNEIPKQLLNDIVNGADNYAQEGNKSDARNKLFELHCAAILNNSKYKPTLTTIPDSPDISFSHNRSKVYVECKRFSSENAYQKNLKKAFKQLEKAFTKHGKKNHLNQSPVGLVFMSITKMLNPEQLMLAANDIETARSDIKKDITTLIINNKEILLKSPKGIIGLFIFARIPVFNHEGFVCYRIIKGTPLVLESDGDWNLCTKIAEKLTRGMSI